MSGSKSNRTLSILLVDDNASMLKIVRDILVKQLNASVDLANTGGVALSKLKEGCYDLMITDLLMPDMDGESLIRSVRSGQATKAEKMATMPIIILSAGTYVQEPTQLNVYFASKVNLENLPGYIDYILSEDD